MLTILLLINMYSTSIYLSIYDIYTILQYKVLYISKLSEKDTNFNHSHQKLEKCVLRLVSAVSCQT